ncbi:MAG: nitrate reductase cytochrome c-type subunit [Planctomycetota bacterium]
MTNAEPTAASAARILQLVLLAVITIAGIGYFVGLYGTAQVASRIDAAPRLVAARTRANGAADTRVLPTVSYSEVATTRWGPNHNWRSHLAELKRPVVNLFEEIKVTRADKVAALAARAAHRAYNGAPPTIPHEVDALSTASCLVCHGDALPTGERAAPRPSHAHYTMCTQCHAPGSAPDLDAVGNASPPPANSFRGIDAPFEGPRAWPGAPPMIPHSLQMRSECLSCHGPTGRLGLRTTHPWRQSCLQCHALPAAFDPARDRSASEGSW